MPRTYRVDISSPKGSYSSFVLCEQDQAQIVATLDALANKRSELLQSYGLEFNVREATYDEVSFSQAMAQGRKVIVTFDDFVVSEKPVEGKPE